MWSNQSKIRTDWASGPISVDQVLYELDGPAIFVSIIGFSNYLFYKKNQLEESDVFLVVLASHEEVRYLLSNKLSLRGALSHRNGWLVELDLHCNVIKYQAMEQSEVSVLLPPPGLPLDPAVKFAPDNLEQLTSYMAVRFHSDLMTRDSMPLGLLQNTINNFADFVRMSIMPRVLEKGRLSRFFDVDVGEPAFSSLLLTVKEAQFDYVGIARNIKTTGDTNQDLIRESYDLGRQARASIMETVALASDHDLNSDEAERNITIIQALGDLVPSLHNEFSSIEISFGDSNGGGVVTVDRKTGERIRQARDEVGMKWTVIDGVITEINGDSRTFRIRDTEHGLTTCRPPVGIFEEMDKAGLIKRGIRLQLAGNFFEKPRVNYMAVSTWRHP